MSCSSYRLKRCSTGFISLFKTWLRNHTSRNSVKLNIWVTYIRHVHIWSKKGPNFYLACVPNLRMMLNCPLINHESDQYPLRPIASVIGSPASKVDWICGRILNQLTQFVPAHLPRSLVLIIKLEKLKYQNYDENICSFRSTSFICTRVCS